MYLINEEGGQEIGANTNREWNETVGTIITICRVILQSKKKYTRGEKRKTEQNEECGSSTSSSVWECDEWKKNPMWEDKQIYLVRICEVFKYISMYISIESMNDVCNVMLLSVKLPNKLCRKLRYL